MIRIAVRVRRDGCLLSLDSSGHASDGSGPAGRNVACAAVSMLLRSAARLLAEQKGIVIEGSAERPGSLRVAVRRIARGKKRYVQGVTEVVLQGLRDVRDDYPEELELTEVNEGE